MHKFAALFLLSVLLLPACSKKPGAEGLEMLKQGDRAAALASLEKDRDRSPQDLSLHYLCYMLYQLQFSQGDAARHDSYLQSAIGEYATIAKAEGLSVDYRDMEGSLNSTDKTRAAYQAAHLAVYGR